MSLSDLSSMAKMSVVGGRERLALLCLAGVKGGSGLEFQLNTSYMDEDILISANKPLNAATLGTFQIRTLFFSFFFFLFFFLSFFSISQFSLKGVWGGVARQTNKQNEGERERGDEN